MNTLSLRIWPSLPLSSHSWASRGNLCLFVCEVGRELEPGCLASPPLAQSRPLHRRSPLAEAATKILSCISDVYLSIMDTG